MAGSGPTRRDWLHAALVALLLFALYAYSAPHTVAAEDDGLFVLSSYFLGVEHPPGYPIFTWIGHLFTYLPVGSIAYRVHLASAFFGALSCAALWLVARFLLPQVLPAWVAALGLGLSPVFWSQAIIAEVYTLNAFLSLVLLYLGLRLCPPTTRAVPGAASWLLPAMALLFGLSLSNHYPLILLIVPAFAVLLWPLRREILNRTGALCVLVFLGLTPYVWMVRRSWAAVPITFDGPLETIPEVWFFISRAGYAGTDHSVSANWLDRIRFIQFFGEQLFVQFAIAGTLLAAAGFLLQWQRLGRRVATSLTIAFVMPSLALILLLGFDYSAFTKHIFHVYPLPAYAIGALWMGAGFAWLAERRPLAPAVQGAAAAILLGLIFAVGSRLNLLADHGWIARHAQAILKALPKDAVVFAKGDADLAPMAYYHLVENVRPDITLYQPQGLVLGNRLFHPLRTDEDAALRKIREFIAEQSGPVVFTQWIPKGYALRDRWLFSEIDRSQTDPEKTTIDLPEEAYAYYERELAGVVDSNAWVATIQNELRRRYAVLLSRSLPREASPDPRVRRDLDGLARDFYGASGIAEGLMLNEKGYSTGAVAHFLERVKELTPPDTPKEHLSRFFYIRGALRANMKDPRGAIADFDTAFALWPNPANPVIEPLEDLYQQTKDERALAGLRDRVQKLKQFRP